MHLHHNKMRQQHQNIDRDRINKRKAITKDSTGNDSSDTTLSQYDNVIASSNSESGHSTLTHLSQKKGSLFVHETLNQEESNAIGNEKESSPVVCKTHSYSENEFPPPDLLILKQNDVQSKWRQQIATGKQNEAFQINGVEESCFRQGLKKVGESNSTCGIFHVEQTLRNSSSSVTHNKATRNNKSDKDVLKHEKSDAAIRSYWSARSVTDEMLSQVGMGTGKKKVTESSLNLTNNHETLGLGPTSCFASKVLSANPWNGWQFQAGTSFEIRVSHLLKLVCMLMVAVVALAFFFNARIKTLEAQRNVLIEELSDVKMHLQILIDRMDTVVSLAIPNKSELSQLDELGDTVNMIGNTVDVDGVEKHIETGKERLVKRSAPATSRTTKGLQYPVSPISFNALKNDTEAYDHDDWTGEGVSHAPSPQLGNGFKSQQGNKTRMSKSFQNRKYIRRLVHQELKKFKASQRLTVVSLKRKIKLIKEMCHQPTNFSCCKLPHSQNLSCILPTSTSASLHNSARAAYLQIDGSSVNIKNQNQVIGPWFLPESGNDIGFNELWYNNLDLNSNGTSIIFKEDGLFLIYAQIFYQLQHLYNSKPISMGYRINLKKSNSSRNRHSFQRPITIAECVPSFPTTVYQTCFTQVAWFTEAGDEIYLEHFAESMPIIEALKSGQTFLGIVRLST